MIKSTFPLHVLNGNVSVQLCFGLSKRERKVGKQSYAKNCILHNESNFFSNNALFIQSEEKTFFAIFAKFFDFFLLQANSVKKLQKYYV